MAGYRVGFSSGSGSSMTRGSGVSVSRGGDKSKETYKADTDSSGSSSSSSSSSSTGNRTTAETPEEYRAKVEAQKEVESQPLSNVPSNDLSSASVYNDTVPSPVNPEYRDAYLANKRAENQQIIEAQQYVPSPINPEYHDFYHSAKNIDVSKLATDKDEIMQQVNFGGRVTLPNPAIVQKAAQETREEERAEAQAAMNLGPAEGVALAYEAGVANTLDPLVTSSNPAVRFVGGATETIAYIPSAIPRLAVGLARNPDATIQEAVNTPIESIHADPARGAGQVVGMIIGPKVAKTGVRAVRGTVGAMEPVVISGKGAVVSAAEGGLSTLKKAGSNPNFDVVGLGRDVSNLAKTKLSPVSEGVNNVLFDAEMVRLKGKGAMENTASSLESSVVEPVGSGLNKIKSPVSEGVNNVLFDAEMVRLKGKGAMENTASSIESSLKSKVNPLKDGLKENIDNSLFDLELKRLESQQKARSQFSDFLKDERGNAEVKPALELKQIIESEIKASSGIKPGFKVFPFIHTSPYQNISPFERVNTGIAERSIQMPSGMEDIAPIQSISNRQAQRPLQKEMAEITAKAIGTYEEIEMPPWIEPPTIPKFHDDRRNKKPTQAKSGSGKEKNLFNKYGNPLLVPDNFGVI